MGTAGPTGRSPNGSNVRPADGGAAASAAAVPSLTTRAPGFVAVMGDRDDIALATADDATTARSARVANADDTSAAAATTGATALATSGGTTAATDDGMPVTRSKAPAGVSDEA